MFAVNKHAEGCGGRGRSLHTIAVKEEDLNTVSLRSNVEVSLRGEARFSEDVRLTKSYEEEFDVHRSCQ